MIGDEAEILQGGGIDVAGENDAVGFKVDAVDERRSARVLLGAVLVVVEPKLRARWTRRRRRVDNSWGPS